MNTIIVKTNQIHLKNASDVLMEALHAAEVKIMNSDTCVAYKKFADLAELWIQAHNMNKAEVCLMEALDIVNAMTENRERTLYRAYLYGRLAAVCETVGRHKDAKAFHLKARHFEELLYKLDDLTCAV